MHICPDEINMIIFMLSGIDIRYCFMSVLHAIGIRSNKVKIHEQI